MEMAKRRRSTASDAQGRNTGGLERPFPSSPAHPPRYCLYCSNEFGRRYVVTFYATYAAKRFIDIVTGGEYKWVHCQKIESPNGVVIASTTEPNPKPSQHRVVDLEEIIEHEYSAAEEAWDIPEPYATQWPMFPALGTPEADDGRTHGRLAVSGAASGRFEPAERPKPPAKPPREPRPQRVAGNVTVGAIASQLGIEATKARAALRAAKEAKPPQGWEWPNGDVERIKAVIKKHMK